MRGMNKHNIIKAQIKNSLPMKQLTVHPNRTKYLKMMRQREIDAMVEITRNQLLDRYDG